MRWQALKSLLIGRLLFRVPSRSNVSKISQYQLRCESRWMCCRKSSPVKSNQIMWVVLLYYGHERGWSIGKRFSKKVLVHVTKSKKERHWDLFETCVDLSVFMVRSLHLRLSISQEIVIIPKQACWAIKVFTIGSWHVFCKILVASPKLHRVVKMFCQFEFTKCKHQNKFVKWRELRERFSDESDLFWHFPAASWAICYNEEQHKGH